MEIIAWVGRTTNEENERKKEKMETRKGREKIKSK